ncbi:ABC-type transport system involved in cytochrome bd biosynthesis fused ATPase/permease subunit [Pseudarthrobacter oxydans]|uniref:ABC-type transport system involved in cytochrome bd biosynthesis fused ATPase/permease subunit n=1 Tax=Pseudarthrobacter oxydans TaxID=1671 RepID=A0AAW8NDV2_PSEOX|nr:hypothetical protein [Pseudarthrobacter oxydans]MDR6794340.1 ABC-type transport system involved in cytochrome bd biosynthesis fused ATPase/permease subunit [Pseudarthrobacter oxydans]MDR7164885.1 ABC-type transport system involved in cytochrome bd biosynthesis fused ATPase/permease subunit [Pseudarthrobacter oxydans]
MAAVLAFIVSIAVALLIYAVVDKIVGLFMSGWLGSLTSFALGFGAVWIASDYYWPVLVKAFGG